MAEVSSGQTSSRRAIFMSLGIDLSDERRLQIFDNLSHGSNPRRSFFLLVAVSTLIASFGLVMNSTAVVIGAMLVAPLMTPILGLALALIRGDALLLGMAARSEVLGVIVSVSAGALLGMFLPSYFQPTGEMLARVSPNLLDLLVAVLAGLAGAYALVDERLSPVLPGVAISTAIVPPLANCGMSLALGAYAGAMGSFLLFFTNFLSILLVSGLVFFLAGMGEELRLRTGLMVARRFGLVMASLGVVGVLLSVELISMFDDHRLRMELTKELIAELGDRRVSDMNNLQFERVEGTLLVLADVNAPSVIEPRDIQDLQLHLSETIGEPVELFVRTSLIHDVSASGSGNQPIYETLDGFYIPGEENPLHRTARISEQLIREYLDEKLDIHLETLQVYPESDAVLVVAEISGSRNLYGREISELEGILNGPIPEQRVRVITRQEVTELRAAEGLLRSEFSLPREPTTREWRDLDSITLFIEKWLSSNGYWLYGSSFTILGDRYHFLLEIAGSKPFGSEHLESFKDEMETVLKLPVELYLRFVPDAVIGPEGYTSMEGLLSDYRERNQLAYPDEYRTFIRESF